MKNSVIALILFFISSQAFACLNKIPFSEGEKAINKALGVPVKSCQELPLEECLCFDGIDLEAAVITDKWVDDLSKPIYLTECPQGAQDQSGKPCQPAGYEQFKAGHKFAHDSAKLAAKQAAIAAQEAAKSAREERRKLAKQKLKSWDPGAIDALSTNASIKAFLKDTYVEIIELLKE
jgi:hypothetical protein